MRSLSIETTLNDSCFYRLDVLLRLFPNLDGTLSLNRFMPPVDQYSALREESKEAQRDFTWRGLDRVVYSAQLAFMLALRCSICCMDIDHKMNDKIEIFLENDVNADKNVHH